LETTLKHLAGDAHERDRLGAAAQRFVAQQQGATARALDLLDLTAIAARR